MNMSEDSLLKYAGKNEDFGGAYNRCRNIQKECLMRLGLTGISPPASFIFVAKNITDMRDSSDITSGGKPLQGVVMLPPKKSDKE